MHIGHDIRTTDHPRCPNIYARLRTSMNIFAVSTNIVSKVQIFANIIVSIRTITNTTAATPPLGMEHRRPILHHVHMLAPRGRHHTRRVSRASRGLGDVYPVFMQGQSLLASISHSWLYFVYSLLFLLF
jgi:hypothetical protein